MKILIILLFVAAVGAGVVMMQGASSPASFTDQETGTRELPLTADLSPLTLTQDERKALSDQGISYPSGTDSQTSDLLRVQSSDSLSAIEQDLDETDLSGIDAVE